MLYSPRPGKFRHEQPARPAPEQLADEYASVHPPASHSFAFGGNTAHAFFGGVDLDEFPSMPSSAGAPVVVLFVFRFVLFRISAKDRARGRGTGDLAWSMAPMRVMLDVSSKNGANVLPERCPKV
jgi:hypothetical protein